VSNGDFTAEEEVKTLGPSPHVVLLGAGASLAAFPEGERNGRRLPVMKNFVEILGLERILQEAGIMPPYDDFETIYDALYGQADKRDSIEELEHRVHDYFAEMQLPDEPTLYDLLVLSLRPKDIIATFNWDPFLWQAYQRNARFAPLPQIVFLHGNVAVGFCTECHIQGSRLRNCRQCGQPFRSSRLLYPIREKKYTADPFIAEGWTLLQDAMRRAWVVTVFGYGAPDSDIEAINLLSEAWGSPYKRYLEEIEIVDVLDREILAKRWDRFIHTHHYRTARTFYDSLLSQHPRRTSEALWAQFIDARAVEGTRMPMSVRFDALYEFLAPRVARERSDQVPEI
jgi:hypothetical protein